MGHLVVAVVSGGSECIAKASGRHKVYKDEHEQMNIVEILFFVSLRLYTLKRTPKTVKDSDTIIKIFFS